MLEFGSYLRYTTLIYSVFFMPKKVIFSGIQPTGNLHIGNYLGAVRHIVELQNTGEYEMYYFVADYHSLTGDMTADERREQIVKTTAELVAAGIDPNKTTLFLQSEVPEHTELSWIFQCLTPMTELRRMTQFKDKSGLLNYEKIKKKINKASIDQQLEALASMIFEDAKTGLFTYPVLQAADILLYHGTVVPVGEDQKQHVELTRDIVRWFNNRYGEYFAEPEVLLTETPRVKSLLDPTSKMSKSKGGGHVIELADSPEVILKKVKKAVTASEGGKKAPGVENLLLLLKEFGDGEAHKQFANAEKDGTIRYGDLKAAVAEAVSSTFAGFRVRRQELLANHNEIASLLIDGAKKAKAVAEATMNDVRERVGIR